MKKLNIGFCLIISAIFNASVFPASAQVVNDGSCSGAIGEGSLIESTDEPISVARKVLRPIGFINFHRFPYRGNGRLLQVSCENPDNQVKFFSASFAIKDDNKYLQKAEISFYLDGKFVKKVNMVKGAVASIAIDNIHKYSSYAYDIKVIGSNYRYADQNLSVLNWRVINRPSAQ